MGLRINHNLASLGAALNLGRANAALSSSLAKLSTGLKINTASDGPADLIISEKFRSQITAISKVTENTQNAISMLSTAEGALAEVNSLLNKMKGLALKATQTATQSPDEIAASQAEIDSAIASINSISRNTSFGSVNLLDGSQAVETTAVNTNQVLVDIDKANFAGATKDITANVVTAAARASTTIDLSTQTIGGTLDSSQVFKITGNRGSTTLTFQAGATDAKLVEEINGVVDQTGVIAQVSAENIITLESAKYGASEFVTVEDVDGDNDILTAIPDTGATYSITEGNSGLNILASDEKYEDYTVNITVRTTAQQANSTPQVFIDDATQTISIVANDSATNTAVATQLNMIATGFSALDNAALAITVKAQGMVAENTPQLTVSLKDGASVPTGDFTVSIQSTTASVTAQSITYNTATSVLTITLLDDTAGALVTGVPTNQTSFNDLVADSTANAAYLDLFDFRLSDTLLGRSVVDETASGDLTNAFVAVANKTSYVSANGTDGELEVNGVKAAAKNLTYTFDNGNIRGNITLKESFNAVGNSTTFTLSGKGAFFQLGQKSQLSHQTGVGIRSVAADQLATGLYIDSSLDPALAAGEAINDDSLYTTATLADVLSGGEFDLASNASTAYNIIEQAIFEVADQRARLGAFISNTLESNVNSLGVAFENLTAAESRIRDVDFASETAELTRAQILVQAGTSVAAQANVATQAALQLLG